MLRLLLPQARTEGTNRARRALATGTERKLAPYSEARGSSSLSGDLPNSGFHASSDPASPRHWALQASAVVLTFNERVPCGDAPKGGRPHHAAAANGPDGAQSLEYLPGNDDLRRAGR